MAVLTGSEEIFIKTSWCLNNRQWQLLNREVELYPSHQPQPQLQLFQNFKETFFQDLSYSTRESEKCCLKTRRLHNKQSELEELEVEKKNLSKWLSALVFWLAFADSQRKTKVLQASISLVSSRSPVVHNEVRKILIKEILVMKMICPTFCHSSTSGFKVF